MPTFQIVSRPANQDGDLTRKSNASSTVYGRGYAFGDRVPVTMHAKHRPGKYLPHYGNKESAKLAARLELAVEEVQCVCGYEYGEPNYDGGRRYCGRQFCCP